MDIGGRMRKGLAPARWPDHSSLRLRRAVLGFSLGAVEAFEPKPVSSLVTSTMLLLCRARLDIVSNLIMGNLCLRAPSRDPRRREKAEPKKRPPAAAVLKRRCFFRIDWQRFDRGAYAR
jgi:hypothetical protein